MAASLTAAVMVSHLSQRLDLKPTLAVAAAFYLIVLSYFFLLFLIAVYDAELSIHTTIDKKRWQLKFDANFFSRETKFQISQQ